MWWSVSRLLGGLVVFGGVAGTGLAQNNVSHMAPASPATAPTLWSAVPAGDVYRPPLAGSEDRYSYDAGTPVRPFTSRPPLPRGGMGGMAVRPWAVPVNYQTQQNSPTNGSGSPAVPPAPAPPADGNGASDVPQYGAAIPTNESASGQTAKQDTTEQKLAASAAAEEQPKYPSVRVTGFFHLDAAYFDQDAVNKLTVGDVQNGLTFRRARLAATGQVFEDVSYMLEFDFAQAQPWFVDVWMQFENVSSLGNVRIGRFRQPFGMSALTSVRELPFLERSLAFALVPFRQTGIMAHGHDAEETATYAVSAYWYLSDNFGNVYGDRGGYGTAMRLTALPYIDACGEQLVHVGLDYSYNEAARNLVQYASMPEVFVGQNPNLGPAGLDKTPVDGVPPFVNTGEIPFGHSNLVNLELAAKYGALVVQSELRWAAVDQRNGADHTFPGFYAHVRYVLTGETVPYNRQAGVFDRIVPYNPVRFGCGSGCGAWELAGRVSYIDLNGDNLPGPGRRMTDTTLGMNWHLNQYTKFQFNWIHAFLDDPVLGKSDADILAARAQIDF